MLRWIGGDDAWQVFDRLLGNLFGNTRVESGEQLNDHGASPGFYSFWSARWAIATCTEGFQRARQCQPRELGNVLSRPCRSLLLVICSTCAVFTVHVGSADRHDARDWAVRHMHAGDVCIRVNSQSASTCITA